MDPFRLAISTWAGVAATPETGPLMPDLVTRMLRHSDNPHSVEAGSTAEVEEGVEATLASAVDPQTTATRSDLETDHHLRQGGEAYLEVTGMTGVQRDAKTTAGSTVMTVSVSLIGSDEILQPAGLTRVHQLRTNKFR